MKKNIRKKGGVLLLACSLTLSAAAPSMPARAASKKPKMSARKVTLNKKDTSKLTVGKKWKKKVKKISFQSKNRKIVTVSRSGRLKARKKGSAVILCRIRLKNNKTYRVKCRVKVLAAPKFSRTTLSLSAGRTAALKLNNLVKKNVKKVTYRSASPSVASVSSGGKVKAYRAGKAVITATVRMKSGKRYSASCAVTVRSAGAPAGTTAAPPTPSSTPSPAEQTTTGPAGQTPADPAGQATADPAGQATADPSGQATADPAGQPTETPAGQATAAPTPAPGDFHLSANGILTKDSGIMRSDITSFDLLHEMGLGINLGNTLESFGTWINKSSVSSFEKAWGAPITSQDMITGMKNAGFHSIRIPVAWSNMISSDGKYTIDERYLDRVEEVMNYALNEGMIVIVNIHYDGGWWAQFGSTSAAEREQAMVKFKAIWTQIANRYKEYSDHLIFEAANEELGDRLNSTDDYAGSGYYTDSAQLYELTNTINQTFVDTVRGTGGNNASRHLLIAGYNTDIGKTCSSKFQMPMDTVENRLMISIHYYSPAPYCLVELEDNSWGYQSSWGSESDISEMKDTLKMMKNSFADKGYPVVIGEYGVADTKKTVNGTEKYIRKEGRDLFFKAVCEYALTHGMCPVLWATPGGVYDRDTNQIANETERELYKSLETQAEKNDVYQPQQYETGTYSWEGTVGCSSWNPTVPHAGENGNINLSSLGGCYQLTGIDWSQIQHPVLKLHAEGGACSASYQLSDTVNAENQYYQYIDKAKISGNWNMAQDITVDLSSAGFTGKDTIYFALRGGTDFSNFITFTVTEK